jgi:HEAT repeat protein
LAIFPPPTAEEQAKIEAGIAGIGDTRHAGGAATRRESARKALVAIGLAAVPALNDALLDGNWYRRMNAASAISEIAPQDRRLELWKDVVPRLIGILNDEVAFVRAAANQALEAISGTNVDYPNPRAGEPTAEERAAIERWARWWEAARRDLRS